MNWSKEQLQAIEEEGKNIIVSAGAGSGKTAVLTARVQRKLLSGIHINRLLVLTFTNAAAAEMKERIRKTINKNEQLYEEANLLDSAFITTFDAFSLALVKKYHTRLNITNNIKITDEVVIDIKKEELLEEIFNENYLTPKKDFMNLINDFCLKEDTILKQYILNIYKKIELKYDKENYLNNYFDYIPTNKNIILDYLDLIKEKQNNIREIFKELVNYFDNDFIIKMEDNFHNLLNANTYSDFKNALNYETIKVPRGTEESGKILKSTIYKEADCIKELCLYKDLDEIEEEINSTIDNIKVILRILIELDKRLTDYKRNNNVFNFTDISRLAIKVVLENDDIKEELTNSFQEILIDEYQDTSDLQEYFISLIEKNDYKDFEFYDGCAHIDCLETEMFIVEAPDNSVSTEKLEYIADVVNDLDKCIRKALGWLEHFSLKKDKWYPDALDKGFKVCCIYFGKISFVKKFIFVIL